MSLREPPRNHAMIPKKGGLFDDTAQGTLSLVDQYETLFSYFTNWF